MNEILREIEDDIRRERVEFLWKKFGKVMVATSLIVIFTTAVMVFVNQHRRSQAMAHTAQFIKGVEAVSIGNFKEAATAFEGLMTDPSSPYYGPAGLRKAEVERAMHADDAASNTLTQMAVHPGVFSDLAALRTRDGIKPDLLAKDAPFFYTGSEQTAWREWDAGKKDAAIARFTALYHDERAPYSLHDRLYEVLQHIAPERLVAAEEGQKK